MSPVRCLIVSTALLPLFAFAQSSNGQVIPEPTACNADDESCREGCTLEFGTSIRTRDELATCLVDCKSKHDVCTDRWTDVHRHELNPGSLDEPASGEAASARPVVAVEPVAVEPAAAPEVAPVEPPVEAPALEPVEGIILPTDKQLRGGAASKKQKPQSGETRAAEARTRAPEKTPARAAEKTPARPEIPPEPEEDLSEWDPDGE